MSTQRLDSTVDIREGDSFIYEGLMSTRTVTSVKRFPVLGDIPGVGPRLFSTKRVASEKINALIVVTPTVLRSTELPTGLSDLNGPLFK